jgi:hypothetical protein
MNDVTVYGLNDVERMARAFAASKLFGVQTPEQAIALCLIAQAEGRHPASAANDYHIVSGRPAKKAEAMLRDFIKSGGKVTWNALSDEIADATFSHPDGGEVRISWDMKRKAQAGINNPLWAKFPRQMLRSRCVSEGVRTVCPAATSGMYEPEETKEFAEASPAPRNVTPVRSEPIRTGKPAKAHAALSQIRDPEGPEDLDPPRDMDDDAPKYSGELQDFADARDDQIDTATNAQALQDAFGEMIDGEGEYGDQWKALKIADQGRASQLAEKAKAKIRTLRKG